MRSWARGIVRVRGREIDLGELGRRALPPFLLSLLAVALHWPLLLGQMPRSQDHMVHLARAWIFTHELLGRGRISGWSSYWFAGYPAGQLYPPGTDMWISTFRALHLGIPDWAFTYAHAYLAFVVVGTLALYWLGLRAAESRFAGVLAGVIWLLDAGAYREGGWVFTMYWGVWSQVLGLVFVVLGLACLDRLLERPDPRRAAVTALAVGFGLLAHPMSVPTLAVLVPSFLMFRWLCRARADRGELALTLEVLGLGGCLAAWWLIPFTTRGEWTIKVPELWRSLDEAGEGMLRGEPFSRTWPVIGVLGLIGIVRAAQERRPLLLALAATAALLMFGSTTTAFEALRLEDISENFGRLIYQRFAIPSKACWFVLAAFGADRVLRLADQYRPQPIDLARKVALAVLCAVLCAPFLVSGVPSIVQRYFGDIGSIRLASQEPDFQDYRRFLEWSRARWDERDGFYRIAYVQPRNEHFMADAPVYNHTPAYKVGWTPATGFRHRPESDDPEVFRALSVRYVISRQTLAGSHLREVERFGRIGVYRLMDERSERYTLVGPGEAEVLQFDEERIRVRVTGATSRTRLTLHVADYADWRATLDSTPLEIRTVPIYSDRYPTFMQVDVPRDGVVEIRFVRPPSRVLSEVLGLLALAVTVTLLIAHRSRRIRQWGERLAPVASAATRFVPILVGVAALAVSVFVAVRLAGPRGGELGDLEYSFSEHLDRVEVALHDGAAVEPCRGGGGKRTCPGPSWLYVGAKQLKVGIVERPCIWAPPPDRGELWITFPEVPLGARLVGRHGLTDFAATQTPEGTDVHLRVSVSDGPRRELVAPNEVGWRSWSIDTADLAGQRRDVTFVVSSAESFRRQYCFEGGVPRARGRGE